MQKISDLAVIGSPKSQALPSPKKSSAHTRIHSISTTHRRNDSNTFHFPKRSMRDVSYRGSPRKLLLQGQMIRKE